MDRDSCVLRSKEKMGSAALLLAFSLLAGCTQLIEGGKAADSAKITYIVPRYGSLNGAVRLTLFGSGFSKDKFSFGAGRSELGNYVQLVSETQTFECETYLDGTTDTQVQCNTVRMPQDRYQVRLSVDGDPVPLNQLCRGSNSWHCAFNAHANWSPTIYTISPTSGPPGTVIKIDGKIFTTRFGSNSDDSPNGINARIKRVYVGGKLCQLRENEDTFGEDDKFFGIALRSAKSHWGYMKCKTTGSYVGNFNVSFILESPYGRSYPEASTYGVTAQKKIAMFQTYAEITGISPSTGSIYGGTRLTINGRYFDQTDAPAKIQIAGTTCKVAKVTDKQILCDTEPKPSSFPTSHPGNRGAKWEFFNESVSYDLYKWVKHATNGLSPSKANVVDTMYWHEWQDGVIPGFNNYIYKLTSFFIPPVTGSYQFFFTADDMSELYFAESGVLADMIKIAFNPGVAATHDKYESQVCPIYNLTAGMAYPLMHVTREKGGNSHSKVGVHILNTDMVGSRVSSNVLSEVQTIYTHCNSENEIQTIQFNNWASQAKTEELQRVTITSSDLENAKFRLGYGGVYTGPFTGTTIQKTIESELNALPSISPNKVSVTRADVNGGAYYDVTFKSELGDYDLLTAVKLTGSDATIDVTEQTKGKPSMKEFALKMMNSTTRPISINAKAADIQSAISDMFSVRCPESLTSPPGRKSFHQDFEKDTNFYESGTWVTNEEPFCGKTCLKNPTWIYRESLEVDGKATHKNAYVDFMLTKYLCFAYKGNPKEEIGIEYYYTLSGGSEKLSSVKMQPSLPESPQEWSFKCINVLGALIERHTGLTKTRLKRINIAKKDSASDLFIDTVFIVGILPSNDMEGISQYRRLPPSKWLDDGVTVTGNANDPQFTIEMKLKDCIHDLPQFSLFGVENLEISGTIATLKSTTWKTGASVVVTKTQEATPPVGAKFDLKLGSHTLTNIPAGVTDEDLKLELQSLPGVGAVDVKRTGTCAGYRWKITWKTAPGDQPPLEMASDHLTGVNVSSGVIYEQNGGLRSFPITGDMLRTINKSPQVLVDINKIPSACVGDCSFNWDDAASPTLTATNPSTGSNSAGTVLTLAGKGFSSTGSDNQVEIGGVACTVTSSSDSQIKCNIGQGPAGTHDVIVTVADKGLAGHVGGTHQFTYEFSIDGIDPTEGSVAGGTSLTISGTGFGTNVTAKVGGNLCEFKHLNYSVVVCETPSGSAGAVDVILEEGGRQTTSNTQFKFSQSLAAVVQSIDKSTVSVEGVDNITITGTGFGSDSNEAGVLIGDEKAMVVSWTDTEVIATVPKSNPGSYTLKVEVEGKGFADTSAIAKIKYDLEVTNIFPTSGSMEGGTILTVTGTGFPSDTSKLNILVGDKKCDVISGTSTQLTCSTPTAGATVTVDNLGEHPEYGKHYAWSQSTLQLKVGDTVQFKWSAPSGTEVKYKIQQTTSPSSKIATAGGFDSGPPTAAGQYKYQFTTKGTKYFSSGYVDPSEKIALRGVVFVADNAAMARKVRVMFSGFDATYNTASGVSDPSDSSSCPGLTGIISGCSENSPSTASSQFYFKYLTCKTPEVSSFSPNNGTAVDTITITGKGFSSTKCKNQVKFGTKTCTVNSATDTEIQCTLDAEDDANVGVMMPFSLSINNRGMALNTEMSDINRHFVLVPHISSIDPTEGSTKGGTLVTIKGGGFYGTVTVKIGLYTCTVTNVTYSNIVCETNGASASAETVVVQVVGVPATCKGSPCEFTGSTSLTPTLTEVNPATIDSDGTELTISGSQFGSTVSDVSVHIGDTACTVLSMNDTTIKVNVSDPIVGVHIVKVTITGKGLADSGGSALAVTVQPVIKAVNPTSGSLNGGTMVRVDGLGFKDGATSVKVGTKDCLYLMVQPSYIECKTPEYSAGTIKLVVMSNSVSYPKQSYQFTTANTPTISSVSPSSGKSGDSISIVGNGFSGTSSQMEVKIDGTECTVTEATQTKVTCTLGAHSAGKYPIVVEHKAKGSASGDVQFTYTLSVSAVSPAEGSFGGGQVLTMDGIGFDSTKTTVTVCDLPCKITGIPTPTQLSCISPAQVPSGSEKLCSIGLTVGNQEATLSNSYTYKTSLTSSVTNVNPRRGGTGGSTRLTITGSGFGTDQNAVTVKIAGTVCAIQTIADNSIECLTGSHKPSIKTKIEVAISTNGFATQDAADYEYIDVWSSPFSWNYQMPEAGDFVIIPKDMTILLDTNTPIMKMLLIDGGKLIFDEKDVELQAEKILITNGGTLQVGTETQPHQSQATITLHGNPRSLELPIYGAKNIAIREGTLDLHGRNPGVTWTLLDATVNAGESEITLQDAVTGWNVGDFIAIASTGHRHSQSENEKRRITAKKNNDRTLVLDSPLASKHMGETVELGSGYTLEARAEVVLLTRNVKVKGSDNTQWHDKIEACPEGFDTGEFVVQTCFQGRFGDETESDGYGVQIMFHPARPSEGLVTGRIENTEITYAGQAFRIGRYAIHFHLGGDMDGNYVRGCAIHNSHNRAVNIHGTNYITLENNVAYNIMGGAFFLEDGVEYGNIFNNNTAIFVKASSSLQNDDVTPAAYWLTNPNNTVTNNRAAGGTHFGFWYRMHEHPDGPSYDANICPQHVPLGIFKDNIAHSQGWFGLWIFKEYYPMEGGGCKSTNPIAAKFYTLTAWNCEKGAEWVSVGAIQFHDFYMVNNEKAGIEGKLLTHAVSDSETAGAMIKGGTIVSGPTNAGKLDGKRTKKAIIPPYGRGLLMKDITFVNFDGDSYVYGVTKVDGQTEDNNGGFTYTVSGLTFKNSPNKIHWRWIHEAVYHDLDGSLTGTAGAKAIPTMPSLPDDKCAHNVVGMSLNPDVPGSVCRDIKFHRISFNLALPEYTKGLDTVYQNPYGKVSAPFKAKRVTHKNGWMALLVSRQPHIMWFDTLSQVTNISYTGVIYDLEPNDFVIMQHNFTQRPDRFGIKSDSPVTKDGKPSMVTYDNAADGEWYFDDARTTLSYMVSGKNSRKKRGVSLSPPVGSDTAIHFRVFRCFYENCEQPVDASALPSTGKRPSDFKLWHNVSTWTTAESGFGGNNGDGTFRLPKEGEDVKINEGDWIVVREPLPSFGKCFISGVLEFEYLATNNGKVPDHVFSCTHIFITGRMIMGWEDEPYNGNAQIVLRGNHLTPDMPLGNGPNVGAKALGVFGGLDLHGKPRTVTWTRLATTANKGTDQITLKEAVDWVAGDEIVIATTGYSAWETETMKIQSISGDKTVLTLNASLSYKHAVETVATGSGKSVILAAEVGLMTHNIKIIGGDYKDLYKEAFGARVLVGKFNQDGKEYIGYARLSCVEFYHAGQEGWSDDYDPRFSLSFLDTGEVTDEKPSYVKKCSFHHNFSPAIGVFNVINMTISDNVIYHTVGASIQEGGIDNKYRHNLVTMMRFQGTFNGRDTGILYWKAGIEVIKAVRAVLTDNAVAGSERAAYQIDGEECEDGTTEPWAGNTAHSALFGIKMLPEDGLPKCSRIRGFTVYKTWDAGIYMQIRSNIVVEGNVLINNRVAIYPMLIGPSSTTHIYTESYVHIKKTVIVATSDDFDCSDVLTTSDRNIFWSGLSRFPQRPSDVNNIAIVISVITIATNMAPDKPFFNIMGYNTIGGITKVSEVTFVNFNNKCNGKRDVIIMTAPRNDDAQHPVRTDQITLINVDDNSKLFFHRANLGTINPSDCVDMECDGMKKALVDDLDGSFIGSVGAYVAESEYAWDKPTLKARGLGDHRIPKTLLTKNSGERIDVSTIVDKKGIIRNDQCKYHSVYQAWECHGLDYEMVMLESMDSDTETRRLSPIALLGDRYLDLINGPQDHGWCFGYTCQKRLSLFPLIAAMGKYYILHYTGTSPQNTRIRILNSDNKQAIVMGIFYSLPQQLEIRIDGAYIAPKNAEYNAQGDQVLKNPTSQGQYLPAVASDPTGSNYFDKEDKILHVLIRGDSTVDISMKPMLVIAFSLPPMTADQFFGEELVNNIAIFLGIPANKIKIAKAVPVTSRRRRAITSFKVELEISNPPSNSSNSSIGSSDDLSYNQLQNITSTVINGVQLGTLGSALNITILDFDVTEPVPAPSSSAWRTVTISSSNGESYQLKIQIPTSLKIEAEPVGFTEGNPLSTHPVLYMTDAKSAFVNQLGSKVSPWKVLATLSMVNGSSETASLSGTVEVEFIQGWANFTNLVISHSGTYKLDYKLTYPTEAAARFSAQSVEFTVTDRRLAAAIKSQDNTTTVGESFNIQAEIVDADTGSKVKNISWKGHAWKARAALYLPDLSPGQLQGTQTVAVDAGTGVATFDNLKVTAAGSYFIMLSFESTPAQYTMSVISSVIDALPIGYSAPVIEVSKEVKIRFDVDYNSTLNTRVAYFVAAVKNKIIASIDSTNVSVGSISLTEGSILTTFKMEGATSKVESALEALYLVVAQNQFSFPFFGNVITADGTMWVDSEVYIRALPTPTSGLSAGALAAIIICCILLLVVIIVIIVLAKKFVDKKNKTTSLAKGTPAGANPRGFLTLPADGTPAGAAERGDLAPPDRLDSYQPQWDSATGTYTNSGGSAQPEHQSLPNDEFQDIDLQHAQETRPTPLPDIVDDDDAEEEDATTAGDKSRAATSRNSSRQSRPPSKPSMVWDADTSGKI